MDTRLKEFFLVWNHSSESSDKNSDSLIRTTYLKTYKYSFFKHGLF